MCAVAEGSDYMVPCDGWSLICFYPAQQLPALNDLHKGSSINKLVDQAVRGRMV